MSHVFRKILSEAVAQEQNREADHRRAEKIYAGCNPVQRGPIDSVLAGLKWISLRCPRRAGKSFAMTSLVLWYGEHFPNSRILVISLTLKSTRENYWSGAPGGIFRQNHDYELGLKFNHTDSVWYHQNGSRGRLAGAETRADIEYLRGAAAEADIVIIDECKSFAPDLLAELIRDVVEPGLMTRDGILVMGGTPGSIPVGAFFEATAEQSRTSDTCDACGKEHPTCIPVGRESDPAYSCIEFQAGLEDVWRLHTWTIADNIAAPNQWKRALKTKKKAGWADDHPTWRREYLGEWVTDATDLVYAWAGLRASGKSVTWTPNPEHLTKDNPAGLPPELGPWHYVLGVDIGYVDESAFVLCAYSETVKELRHVYDFKRSEMLCDDFIEEVLMVCDRYGIPEAIVADTGGAGAKILVETLNARHGTGIIPAEKQHKQAFIELINSDFHSERIKIQPGTDLAHELAGLQWDLSRNSKLILARTGSLKEDPSCPNHLCDALLYLWRYAHHYFSEAAPAPIDRNTAAWVKQMEKEALERAAARKQVAKQDRLGLKKLARQRPMTSWQN